MADPIQKGSLFWWKPIGDPKRHLRIIASNPSDPRVVIVPMESYRTGSDLRWLFNEDGKTKDIDELPWTSVPAYGHVEVMSPQRLAGILTSKDASRIEQVVGQVLINRVLTAVYYNEIHLQAGVFETLKEILKANQPKAAATPRAGHKPTKNS